MTILEITKLFFTSHQMASIFPSRRRCLTAALGSVSRSRQRQRPRGERSRSPQRQQGQGLALATSAVHRSGPQMPHAHLDSRCSAERVVATGRSVTSLLIAPSPLAGASVVALVFYCWKWRLCGWLCGVGIFCRVVTYGVN